MRIVHFGFASENGSSSAEKETVIEQTMAQTAAEQALPGAPAWDGRRMWARHDPGMTFSDRP
jgi:hypothetical protein